MGGNNASGVEKMYIPAVGPRVVQECTRPDPNYSCDSVEWNSPQTQAECLESKGTCAGADPDIPDGTCAGAGWVGTPAACEESAGTCAGADPDVPGTTTKALCDDAATTAGTFTSTAVYALTPTTKAACDGAATTAGTFTSTAAYERVSNPAPNVVGVWTPALQAPQAAHVHDAHLTFEFDVNRFSPGLVLRISIDDADSAAAPSEVDGDLTNRTAHDLTVLWALDPLLDAAHVDCVMDHTCDGAPWADTETACEASAGTCDIGAATAKESRCVETATGAAADPTDAAACAAVASLADGAACGAVVKNRAYEEPACSYVEGCDDADTCEGAAWTASLAACGDSAGTCDIGASTTKTDCLTAASCEGALWAGTEAACAESAGTCTVGATCDGAAWAGAEATCFESKGTCAGANPDVPGTTTKVACDAVVTTCEGVDWSGTQTACLESKGTCAGADPDVPGTTTKAACDAAAMAPGTFTSTAAYAATTAGTFTSTSVYSAGGGPTCERTLWAGTQAECLESVGTCAGADPDVPGTTTKAACDGAAATCGVWGGPPDPEWAATEAECLETRGTCAGADPDVPGTTTKADCDAAATTPGTFTTTATYTSATPGTFTSTAAYSAGGIGATTDADCGAADTCEGLHWTDTETACRESVGTCSVGATCEGVAFSRCAACSSPLTSTSQP
jgi:hypothetical protein